MLNQIWKSCHRSVCSLNFQNERGVSIDTLSGFKVNQSLVTTDYAFYIPKAKKVEISFVDEDANTIIASMKIPYHEFINDLRIGVFDNHTGYSIFKLDFPDFKEISGLQLSERRKFQIGQINRQKLSGHTDSHSNRPCRHVRGEAGQVVAEKLRDRGHEVVHVLDQPGDLLVLVLLRPTSVLDLLPEFQKKQL